MKVSKVSKVNKIEITNLYLYKVGDIVQHRIDRRLYGEIIKRYRSSLSNCYVIKHGNSVSVQLEADLDVNVSTNRMGKLKQLGYEI